MLRAAVPEAAVDKDSDSATGENNVGGASLSESPVQPEPRPGGVERLAQSDLRGSAFLRAAGQVSACGGAHPLLNHTPKASSRVSRHAPRPGSPRTRKRP